MVDAMMAWDALPRPDPFINEELIHPPQLKNEREQIILLLILLEETSIPINIL